MSNEKAQAPKIRRVITGHDAKGKAVVWKDDFASNHKWPNEQACATTIWTSEGAPTDFLIDEDGAERSIGSAPPEKGTRFSSIVLQPGYMPGKVHRTDTLDYSIVITGKPTLYLDDGERVDLAEGDIVIQRGTNHAWANHTDEVVFMMGVLVDGSPKREGSIAGNATADAPAAS